MVRPGILEANHLFDRRGSVPRTLDFKVLYVWRATWWRDDKAALVENPKGQSFGWTVLLFFDIETTGFSLPRRIIEIRDRR